MIERVLLDLSGESTVTFSSKFPVTGLAIESHSYEIYSTIILFFLSSFFTYKNAKDNKEISTATSLSQIKIG